MPEALAVYVGPAPKLVSVPLGFVPCQYHVVPAGGFPERETVTEAHCGELLDGVAGTLGNEFTTTKVLALLLLQQLAEVIDLR